MDEPRKDRRLSRGEFIALTALLTSLSAMATDAMLPALGEIGRQLGVARANDTQLVVSAMFLGMAAAQMIFGPLSDSVGRKPALYSALAIFLFGSLLSMVATSFAIMLVGRALQGVGAAGPRIVAVAVVRDQYRGRGMARVLSVVTAVFIIVPVLAPAIGQGVLLIANWRAVFGVLLLQGLVGLVWFAARQPETLPRARRQPLHLGRIGRGVLETCTHRASLGYTVAAGLSTGAFFGYLSSAQQIFQSEYGVGRLFPVYFGSLAASIGAAALLNSRLVQRLGMHHLCWRALVWLTGLSLAFAAITYGAGEPPLWGLMLYLFPVFFCIGILFGNFKAMAMEPLGHIAGTAAAVIGSLTTFLAFGCGTAIGQLFDGTVRPLVVGFALLGAASLGAMRWADRGGD